MGCMLSQLAAKFGFFPPSPPSYQIEKTDDGALTVVPSSSSVPLSFPSDGSLEVHLIDTRKGNTIVSFFLRNPLAKLTVLYSHGNAADLGQLYHLFVQLKVNLQVNIFGYDYSGYGASTGKPSERDAYADIEAAYSCLENKYGISEEDVILYGQSVGSGPTLHLASKLLKLRGVVLHSAILSGIRVVCHVDCSCCLCKNTSKIKKVKCPVLVIHGTEDEVVEWRHGRGLVKKARLAYEPLWIKGGGHCNLETYPEYFRHVSRFVKDVESGTVERKRSGEGKTASVCRCCRVECCWWPRCERFSVASFSCCCCPKISTPSCVCGYCTCCNCFNVSRCCFGGLNLV